MIRQVISTIFLLTTSASLCAQEPSKQSPAVKRILDEAAREVRANRLVFEKANQKPLGNARKELQDLSTKLIQAGKTAEAQAVLKQVETLEADIMKMASAPPPAAGRAATQTTILDRMTGKWDRHAHPEHLQVARDGRAALCRDSDNGVAVTGQIAAVASDGAEIQWDNGFRWQLRIADDDSLAVIESRADGDGPKTSLSLVRIK